MKKKLLVTLRNVALICLLGIGANILTSTILGAIFIIDVELRFFVGYLLSMLLLLTGVWVYDWKVTPKTEKTMWRAAGFDPIAILWGLLLIVALSIVLAPLMRFLPDVNRNIPTGLTTILCVIVAAPIFEEFIFRAKLFSIFRSTLSPLGASLLSSLFFGAMHGSIAVGIEGFLVGIVLSYIYILKGSIFAPIILHILNNLVAYVLMIFKYQERTIEDFIGDLPMFSTIYIVSAIIVIAGAVHIAYIYVKANRIVADGNNLIMLSRGDEKSVSEDDEKSEKEDKRE